MKHQLNTQINEINKYNINTLWNIHKAIHSFIPNNTMQIVIVNHDTQYIEQNN
jgi:hypothetical protein